MKGLIWKDFLVCRKTFRLYGIFFVLYLAMCIAGMFSVSVITSISIVIVMTLPVSAFALDEAAKWDTFAVTLPVGRKAVVRARYGFALILVFFSSAALIIVGSVLSLIQGDSLPEFLLTGLLILGYGLLMIDILLPLSYLLGADRARTFYLVIWLLPFLIVFILLQLGLTIDLSFLNRMNPQSLIGLVAMFPVLSLGGMVWSYAIACRVMEKKEY